MRIHRYFVIVPVLALGAFVFNGCGGTEDSGTTSDATTNASDDHDEDGDHDHEHGDDASGKTAMEKMAEGLASLSAEDRAAAEKQHTCPVTGDMLGTMGTPIKVNVSDTDVWVCCDGCQEPLRKDPAKYLAKMNK